MPEQSFSWRTRNVGRLLLCSTDAFVSEKLQGVYGSGFGPVSQVHFALIQNIDFEGTRLTLVAARARMTKQSMLELTHRAELLGLVERRDDAADGRAKIIAFTAKGLQMMEMLKDGIAEAERGMAAVLGTAFVSRMRGKLAEYLAKNDGVERDLVGGGIDAAWRTHNVGRLLSSAFTSFTRDVHRSLHAGGFAEVSEIHMTLFRNLDIEGTRPTELAARARMSKQALTDLVRRTELLGLVERSRDPGDGRAQIVTLTAKGMRLVECTRIGIERAERRMANLVGSGFVAEIRRKLPAYVAHVQPASFLATGVAQLASAKASPRLNPRRPAWAQTRNEDVGSHPSPASLLVTRAG